MYLKVLGNWGKLLAYIAIIGITLSVAIFTTTITRAAPGINQQMNFQGRLLNAQGAVVPDGRYNIQFKIYQDGDGLTAGNTTGTPAGILKWTESHLNASSQGVIVKNGYMSVQLGSVTPFGTAIDWNQDVLWLSMNIASTNATCTPFASCTPDGEMTPMKRLSAAPFAINSSQLGGMTSAQFLQFAQGVQTDASTNTSSIHINKTGTGNFLSLQASSVEAFTLANNGDIAFGANDNHTISVVTASEDSDGKALAVSAGSGGIGAGNTRGGSLSLQGGAGGGVNGIGGNVIIDAGAGIGSGADGEIAIGTASASTITLGGDLADGQVQDIAIGNNSTGGTTNVTIGSDQGAAAGSTTLQAKNAVTIKTDGTTQATFNNSGLYLGNGVTANAPSNFTISGTASTSASVAGGAITLQGGNASVDNSNGGDVIIRGGTSSGSGSSGLVILSTPTFSTTTNDSNCYTG